MNTTVRAALIAGALASAAATRAEDVWDLTGNDDTFEAYGTLTGKAVALEPSTGFTFDTAMVPRLE